MPGIHTWVAGLPATPAAAVAALGNSTDDRTTQLFRAGALIASWKRPTAQVSSANVVVPAAGTQTANESTATDLVDGDTLKLLVNGTLVCTIVGGLTGIPTVGATVTGARSGAITLTASTWSGSTPPPAWAGPTQVVIENWASGSAVDAGTIPLDVDLGIMTMEDSTLAAAMGGMQVMGSAASVTLNGFEYGAIAIRGTNLAKGGGDLYQVVVAMKPAGRWATYPFADTFNTPTTDSTHPTPFKVRVLNASNTILGRIQMRDGVAINDPAETGLVRDSTHAHRPRVNCANVLVWQNAESLASTNPTAFFPAYDWASYRPSIAKKIYGVQGSIPNAYTDGVLGRTQINGFLNWQFAPQWPVHSGGTYGTGATYSPTADPYALPQDITTYFSGGGLGTATGLSGTFSGWDFEPGSISCHDWFTGPGGFRFDRAVQPHVYAQWVAAPTSTRLKGGEPIEAMARAFGLAYANHSCHWFSNVKTMATPIDTTGEYNTSPYKNAYYATGNILADNLSIDIRSIANGEGQGNRPDSFFQDSTGQRVWNGWANDDNHAYQVPHWWVMGFNSPMHVLMSRNAFISTRLAQLGTRNPTIRAAGSWAAGPGFTTFMKRQHAWRILQLALQWKIGTTHSLGIPRSTIQSMIIAELQYTFDNCVAIINAENTNPFHVAIKRFGVCAQAISVVGGFRLTTDDTPLGFYMASVFPFLKTSGLWPILMADTKSADALTAMFNWYSKNSVDFILDTQGRAEQHDGNATLANGTTPGGGAYLSPVTTALPTVSDMYADWAAWATANPANGPENWIKDSAGAYVQRYSGQFLRAQWAFMARDFFPELAYPRLTAACNAYQAFFDEFAANVASKATAQDKSAADFTSASLPYWKIKV